LAVTGKELSMARYESGKGSRYGPGGHGSRRDSKYGRRDSRYGGGGGREEDEYEEEPPYYGEPAKRKLSHEQITLIIFGVVVGLLLIVLIASMAGQSFSVPRGTLEEEMGYKGKKAEEYKQDAREREASGLLQEAESFDRSNPYEEKEIVAEKYQDVVSRYSGTKAAQEAQRKYNEVMDRRR
jgi:hypothetical protein